MRGPGQIENPQFGCKVDNKYDAIADGEDPFEALERLEKGKGVVVKKDVGSEKSKSRPAGEKQVGNEGGSARKADAKKESAVASKPQSATSGKHPDTGAKKPAGERAGAQERPKTAGDKPARADGQQQDQRRQRGGGAARGGPMPQQAGVIGLQVANVDTGSAQAAAAGGDEGNTDGFMPQRLSAGNNRGRRGAPRGGAFYGPGSAGAGGGGYRRPYRGGFGGTRPPPASDAATGDADAARDAAGGAQNEAAETDDRVDRGFGRPRPYGQGQGNYRGGQAGFPRRGGPRRGGPGGFFEDGTGRKREFERHSGSDVTGVRPVDKKEGSGQHNWGTMRDDLAAQTETPAEGEQAAGGAPNMKEAKAGEAWTDLVHADESEKAAEGTNAEGEQQDKMYVLDDWKAKEEKERFRVPEFNVRKANEGVDESSKWSAYVLKKREAEAAAAEEGEAIESEETPRGDGDDAKRKAKQRVNIPVEFANPAHRGRGAYGPSRGGPRGAGRPPSYEHREGDERRGGEERRGGDYRGGYDRPRGGSGSGAYRGGNRGGSRAPGGAQSGAPQLTMDEFPSLNKQAA